MKEAEEFHKLRKEEQKREPNYIPPGADGYTNELGQYYKGGVLFAPITENKNNLVWFDIGSYERLPIGRRDNGKLYYYTDEEEKSNENYTDIEKLFDEAMEMAPLI